ncbi:hypothetical protein GCM10008935_16710 [Alkalibacillus silvisoli]|uniref:Integrase n=1 Tax=Alkalibacillus silvisoli TaxID=392823 RepID=A0ABN0ZX62_9BACI
MAINYRKHNGKWEYRIRYHDPITKKLKCVSTPTNIVEPLILRGYQ